MNDLINKISSYNLFNYFFPGTVFVYLCQYACGLNFIQDNLLIGAFLYYFIGLIISRVGSLIIEPILEKTGKFKKAPYRDYVSASKVDPGIEIRSEVNNTYRTLAAMGFCLIFLKAYVWISNNLEISESLQKWIISILIFVLFILAHWKQNKYVRERIEANTKKTDT